MVLKSENKKESESPAEAVQSAAIALPVPPDGGHGWIQVLVAHTISGRLFDAGYFRHLLIIGSFLQVLGIFMASISTEYWHLFLAQGVCSGIGAGLAYCPVMACVSTYFTKKRAFAIAVVTSGSATGGIIFPIIAQQVMYVHGFPWTIRCMAFVILFKAIIVVALAKELLLPRKSSPVFEFAAFREMPFVLFSSCIIYVKAAY
ncbi:hypothetical protein HYE68_011217 [Fusarium pseudograminearum]|nr:hypothetical protein HYE68_011217 [Fusarium pseudograminearum]